MMGTYLQLQWSVMATLSHPIQPLLSHPTPFFPTPFQGGKPVKKTVASRTLWNGGHGGVRFHFCSTHARTHARDDSGQRFLKQCCCPCGRQRTRDDEPQACPEASSVSPRAGLPTTSTDAALAAVVAATADGWLAVDASASRQVEVPASPQSPHRRLPLPRMACQLSPPLKQLLQT